jgi:acyl dehydratase
VITQVFDRDQATCRARITVLAARLSKSKPNRGIVRTRGQLINQNDGDVLRLDLINIFARRSVRTRS